MEMLMIAVCDDEVRECLNFSRKIESLLKKMCVPCVVRQYNSGKALLKEAAAYEIIFLDIMMDEMDGMQTARMLRRNYPEKFWYSFPPADSMYSTPLAWKRLLIW